MADMIASGELQQMDTPKRESLVEAATKVIAQFHRSRIAWRSMKPKHFYPEDLGRGNWRIWLIDCEGVSQRASKHDCDRQWRMYLKSLTSGAPAMRDAFLNAYALALGA